MGKPIRKKYSKPKNGVPLPKAKAYPTAQNDIAPITIDEQIRQSQDIHSNMEK